jgi:polyhydroxybutyrate depolymerase
MSGLRIFVISCLVTVSLFVSSTSLAKRFSEEQLRQAQTIPEETDIRTVSLGNGSSREYSMYLPKSLANRGAQEKFPILLVFHGGGGPFTSRQKVTKMKNSTRFDQIAERERFIVVYPMANGPHWNDERPEMPKTNDLEYVNALISELTRMPNVDARRVYATGISNGAFFVNYLGLKLSDRISGIASLCGPIPQVDAQLRPSRPVSALLIDGTDDPKVPFTGGDINQGVSGQCLSHDQSVGYWISVNGGAKKAISQAAVASPSGGNSQISVWQTNNGAYVGSVMITGGGHQWYTARLSNFDASEFIWLFFKSQYNSMPH